MTDKQQEYEVLLKEIEIKVHNLENKEKRKLDRFKYAHKVIFTFIIFFAINLLWYGMWTIISELPILKNPVIAVIIGAIILIASGYFYENMIPTI